MLKSIINDLLLNFPLLAAAASMLTAQTLKVFCYYFKEKKFNFMHFWEAGGMPSGHASAVTGLTLATGILYGWHSALFAIALVFSLIVMYDAAGVRRAASEQALFLNKIAQEIKFISELNNYEKLREILGHTPLEVVTGASIGIIITLIIYFFYIV